MTRDKTMCSGVVIHEKKSIKLEQFTFFFYQHPNIVEFCGILHYNFNVLSQKVKLEVKLQKCKKFF